ncbi:LytTR family transcriptional regulator [Flavobacteriaceae bacterium TP-CH-4]|uniref:LytTR family transcriptional regulator n=1 Tax=Pelagihabitans pacificus TaxID=2696054 RepID=A0A967E819_9FLAO|nr:LytTR family DNA-binding domain-containing protein [Pelagihabitans pacificus]NHF61200.1 LytTR family transcriptional regulator [Pelagihabitans pacificus]
MLQLINQKYPPPNPGLRSIITALLFGLFIGLFLLFFEPFDINLATYNNKVLVLLFFGLITALVLFVFLYLLPLVLPKVFSDKHWKVKHQIILYFIILFVIATLNGVYTNYINSLNFSWSNYWWIINRTFVLGGIPITFLTLIDYHRKITLNVNQANEILETKKEFKESVDGTTYQFSTDLKNEIVNFNEDDFYYAMAEGNYIDMFSLDKNQLKKVTYRVSLSSFENQLTSTCLKRCHRSYLVNLKKVTNISGNAQGLKLELRNQTVAIPVSRKYIPSVKQFFLQFP